MYEDSEMSVRDMILNYLETTQASSNGVNEYWHFATGGRHFAWLRHGWDVGEAVGWAIKEGVSAGTCRCDVIARLCTSLSRWALSTCTLATSRHRAIEPDRIHAAKAHARHKRSLFHDQHSPPAYHHSDWSVEMKWKHPNWVLQPIAGL